MKFHLVTLVVVLSVVPSAVAMAQSAEEPTTDSALESESVPEESTAETSEVYGPKTAPLVSVTYFGIFYGPALKNPTSYQPTSTGTSDREKPVILKNFLNVGRDFTDNISVIGSAYWIYQPVLKQDIQMQDPFLRVTYNSIFNKAGWNLYGDVRGHFPVTKASRDDDLRFGLQTFQALTYEVPASRLTAGMYASERANFYGKYGIGNDVELYLAPNLNYQISSKLAFTLLYEIQRSHIFGTKTLPFANDGTDIAPGISWDITPQLMLNPYLTILTDSGISLNSTSFGMMLNLVLL